MNKIILYSILFFILIVGVVIYLIFKRNYFNKHKYIRLVKYNNDMTISVSYTKREEFNKDNSILINPKHVYNFNGYKSIIITANAQESINPIDFEANYPADKYKVAIKSKAIKDAFQSMQPDKFDKVMALIVLNIIQLLAIAYLLFNLMGGAN